jgi:hypothetical protein
MQGVSMKVPVSKCLDLATYSIRMFGKFKDNAALTALVADMKVAAGELAAAQNKYEEAVEAILPTRVDVKYENIMSDRRIRLTQQKAEIADGKRGGKIVASVLPDGSQPVTRLQGESQVKAMKDLEGRLDAAKAIWPEAEAEKVDIKKYRESYAAALEGRSAAAQKARDLRAQREASKERFATKYTEIQARVEAEFPRDKVMQDLFFDEVRTNSALEEADDGAEEEPGRGGSAEGESKPD